MISKTMLAAAAITLTATALPGAAWAGPVGELTCNVSGGAGFVITSSHALNCRYAPSGGGPSQHYVGTIGRFGLDIGVTSQGRLSWGVVSAGGPIGAGSLAGSYSGGSASATVGVGVGANALVGGNNGAITLQPVSVQTQTGLDIAAGIGTMTLEYAP